MEVALREEMALRRIAATLAALAALAERAVSLSFPMRWLVLSILWSAEAVARAFVIEATGSKQPCFDAPPETGSSPLDAASLALRFRALVAALNALLDLACRFDRRHSHVGRAPHRLAPRPRLLSATPAGWMQRIDTS